MAEQQPQEKYTNAILSLVERDNWTEEDLKAMEQKADRATDDLAEMHSSLNEALSILKQQS